MFYLYLKTHNITGLKYLGYTKKNPYKYKGSGSRWYYHRKKYGNDVSTQILLATEEFDELSETGLFFSKLWNVVESKDFANMTEEDGNKCFGKANPNFKGHPQSLETRKKISENSRSKITSLRGSNHPSFGKSRPDNIEKSLPAMWEARRGNPSWNSGKTGLQTMSPETREKMSLAKIGKPKPTVECPYCKKIGGLPQMKQWHFDKCKMKDQENSHSTIS